MTKSRDTADSINRIDSSAADATAITIDASENVLVGTTTLSTNTDGHELRSDGKLVCSTSGAAVAYFNRNTDNGQIIRLDKDGTTVGSIGIDSGGFYVDGEANHTGLRFKGGAVTPRLNGAQADNTVGLGNATERFSDLYLGGNLLVGTTDDTPYNNSAGSSADNGLVVSGGRLWVARYSGTPLDLNRTSDDGGIVNFRKDGTVVGSIRNNSTNLKVNSNAALELSAYNSTRLYVNGGGLRPWASNTYGLGAAGELFTDVWAVDGSINTSDGDEKQQISNLTEAEITAAKAISKLFKTFKWNSAVDKKGANARTHTGVIAQEVRAALEAEGLDARNYAFFISGTWWETQTEVPAVEAVEAVDAVYDEDGNLVSEAVEAVEAKEAYTRTDTYDTAEEAPEGATERTRLGIRYHELLAFIGAATEQRLADIETRLTALEA